MDSKMRINKINAARSKKQISAHVGKILVILQQVTSVLGGAAEYDPRAKVYHWISRGMSF
jgi:hypothetical protein